MPAERAIEAAVLATEAWDRQPFPGRIAKRLRRKRARTIVAIAEDGAIAGVTTAMLLGGGRARSDETVVAAAFRGRGLAEAMLDVMVALLSREGVRVIEGESSPRRPEALAFFERYGFRVTGEFRSRGQNGFPEGERVLRTELDVSSRLQRVRAGAGAGLSAGGSAPAREPAHSSPG